MASVRPSTPADCAPPTIARFKRPLFLAARSTISSLTSPNTFDGNTFCKVTKGTIASRAPEATPVNAATSGASIPVSL